jgi:hypothetical protein
VFDKPEELEEDNHQPDEPIEVGKIITPAMRKAGVAAWMNCPTKNVEIRCVTIFIAMMQALDPEA